MLKNMSSLIEEENLTDMTIQCSDGMYVHTHQKLLSSVSSLTRKLSREQNVIVENQRLHLIINVSWGKLRHFGLRLHLQYNIILS